MTKTENSRRICDWAEEDRPREKLLEKGRSALTDAELIAILIGSGTPSESAVDVAKKILRNAGNNLLVLGQLSLHELTGVKGIGNAKAVTLLAAMELARRRRESDAPKRKKITNSRHVYEEMMPYLLDKPHEEFWIILLNRANDIIRPVRVSSGGISGTVVDPKIIFKCALEQLASAIILVHNHPSGGLTPSKADRDITKRLSEAGRILEIPVLDHVIFTDKGYLSFGDEGML